MAFPLGYHITFGTYGTRLHGDERGTVDRSENQHGDPIIGGNDDWQYVELTRLNWRPIVLSDAERRRVEALLPRVCEQGGWTLHACAAQPDHVHVLVSAERDGKAIRRWMKQWLTEGMNAPGSGEHAAQRARRIGDTVPGSVDVVLRRIAKGQGIDAAQRIKRMLETKDDARTHHQWWAECGSVKWCWQRDYFDRVHTYIQQQRTPHD